MLHYIGIYIAVNKYQMDIWSSELYVRSVWIGEYATDFKLDLGCLGMFLSELKN